MTKVLVTGSRNYTNRDVIRLALQTAKPTHVIHGAARGADRIADEWCKDNNIPVTAVPADWSTFGKRAGPMRNTRMLNEHPDISMVLAFPLPGSVGTYHMVTIAKERGIDTHIFRSNS